MAHYAFLNNDATTETLREELAVLWSEMGILLLSKSQLRKIQLRLKQSKKR